MSLLKRLGAIFGSTCSPPDARTLYYYVRCRRCGEILKARIDLYNELSPEYNEQENVSGYVHRKALIGSGRCFQQMEVTLGFGPGRNVNSRAVSGGEFATQEEYEAAAG